MNIKLVVRIGFFLTLMVGIALSWARAQTPREVQARELDILRRTLAEQQGNPGKIIRTPQTLAFSTNAAVLASRADLERQYLDGKITAKQFQRSLDDLQQEDRKRAAEAARHPVAAANVPASTSVAPATKPVPARSIPPKETSKSPTPTAAPAGAAPGADSTPEQKKISDVESRIEEMLRLKAAREKASATNAPASSTPAAPQTKRQRLDALLKQLVDGKISEAEYSEKRAKIVAEPD